MSRIRPVLFTKSESGQPGLSLAIVDHWIEDLRGIPYGFTQEWKIPSEWSQGLRPIAKAKRWCFIRECKRTVRKMFVW